MEKRLLLAVLLMGAVIMITNILFPPVPPVDPAAKADSARVAAPAAPRPSVAPPVLTPAPAAAADSVVVRSGLYEYVFSTRGAALTRAELLRYPSYTRPGGPVQLVPPGTRDFLAHRLVVGADTIDLRAAPFQASARSLAVDSAGGPQSLSFTYAQPSGFAAELTYTFEPDDYLIGVRGRVTGAGAGAGAKLLTHIGPGLAPHEAFDHHSERELALVTRVDREVDRERLDKIEGVDTVGGPLAWAGIKDKYFLAAIIAGDSTPMAGALAADLPDVRQPFVEDGDTSIVDLPRVALTTELPLGPDGTFAFQAYLGPQEYGRLKAVGYELEDATPYGYRWLQPVVRPFAALIISILDFLHDSLEIGYGWVLVIFGVMMRVVLWPLNARAMRAQMKNAAVAPMMQEIREKYKDDPEMQQKEMLRLYKEEGFNPMAGCLPMLVPFPVLITLFFVFQSTIGFRGADFLWLPDLSLRDPLYILPIFLVGSMFLLQWISTKLSGMEQNAQMKMMMYFMPIMIGVFFFTMPAGLNLYYAATNVASMPQQILIARERRRTTEAQKAAPKPPSLGPTGGKGPKKKAKG